MGQNMKELQRLVKIIDEFGPTSNQLLNLQDNSLLETKLFNLLKSETIYTDEDVARLVYGKENLTGGFRTLKFRFRKKLYNHLHILEYSYDNLVSNSDINYACQSLLIEAYALMRYFELKLALKVFDQVKDVADKFDNNEAKIKALEGKVKAYQLLNNNKEHKSCRRDLERLYETQIIERKALTIYDETIMALAGTVSQKSKILNNFPTILIELWHLWEVSNSSMVFFHRHILQISYLEQLGKYHEIIDAIAQAEKLVYQKKVNTGWYNRKYNAFIEVYALLQCREYKKGIKLAERNIHLFKEYSGNWFSFLENFFLLNLHSKKHKQSFEILCRVTSNIHISKQNELSLERWEIYRKHLLFIFTITDSKQLKIFPPEIAKHLPILSKDKSGFNLALLVLDVLERLSVAGTDELEGQVERVRKYSQKYLKGEKAERPRLFLRLLLLALTSPSAADARKQGQKLLEKLQQTPLPGDAFSEVEIVPYEHLWEFALEILESHNQ